MIIQRLRKPWTLFGSGPRLALGTIVLASGCTSYPNDMRLVSVTAVDGKTDPRIPYYLIIPRPTDPVLKVTFRSTFDLLPRARETTISVVANFCRSEYRQPDLPGYPASGFDTGGVFASGRHSTDWRDVGLNGDKPLPRDADGRITYDAYLTTISRAEDYSHSPPEQAWDLTDHPHDVCFKVRGHEMTSVFQSSNTIRIPEAAIRAALDRR